MRMPTWSAVPLRALGLTLALAPIAGAQGLQPLLMVLETPVTPGKEGAFL